LSSDRLFKRYVSTSLSERNSRNSFLLPLIFSLHFRKNCTSSVFFLKLGSLQVLPWNLRQLISYFFAFIIYSINLLKTARKTFATGNAIYALPRTIIQITNANSIFHKEGIETLKTVILWIITQFRHPLLYAFFFSKKKKKPTYLHLYMLYTLPY
jgi:hypothetical protein